MNPIDTVFAQNPVFGLLPPAERERLINLAIHRRVKKGETIVHAGDVWPYLFLVARGSVTAHKKSLEGRSLVVTTFTAGDVFWGLAFFYDDMPMPVSLDGEDAAVLYLWPAEVLHPVLKKEPRLAWELTRLMVMKMKVANEILEEIAFQPVAGRLAKLLLETVPGSPDGVIARSLTLDEMAARIGSTREMVCRFLHRFADDGIIEITRTEFRITNPQGLATVSKFEKG